MRNGNELLLSFSQSAKSMFLPSITVKTAVAVCKIVIFFLDNDITYMLYLKYGI